jgi:hypothetical protein
MPCGMGGPDRTAGTEDVARLLGELKGRVDQTAPGRSSEDREVRPARLGKPLVCSGPLCARGCCDFVRDDRPRPVFRLRGDSGEPRRRAGRGDCHPRHGRRLDGEPGGARSDDHDGRRPAGDGPVLTADRAAHPPGQAEPARDRPLRRHFCACDPRDPRGDQQRRWHGQRSRDRGRDSIRARPRQHRGARHVRAPHRSVAARLVSDRARRQGHAGTARS